MNDHVNVGGDAMKELAKVLPAQEVKDALKPSLKRVGHSLETILGTIDACFLPLRKWMMEREYQEQEFRLQLAAKLKSVPKDRLITPNARVAVPILRDAALCGDEPVLRRMYATLLATAMDSDTANSAHPGFTEIIRQLVQDEALMLNVMYEYHKQSRDLWPTVHVLFKNKSANVGLYRFRSFTTLPYVAKCNFPDSSQIYIENLIRLGLVELTTTPISKAAEYIPLLEHPKVIGLLQEAKTVGKEGITHALAMTLTEFGKMFCLACVAVNVNVSSENPQSMEPQVKSTSKRTNRKSGTLPKASDASNNIVQRQGD